MESALTFNDVSLFPITHQNNLWIRAAELAVALGYKQENSVSRLYRSNADEFTPDMTQVIEIIAESRNGSPENLSDGRCRIFSLRGCHLLAMFARTPVAKQFRRWVLDVLDKLAEEERAKAEAVENTKMDKFRNLSISESTASDASLTPDQQCTLQALVKARVESIPKAERPKGLYPQIWSRFNNHFCIARYCQLPQSRLSEAIAYLARMDLASALPSAPLPTPKQDKVPAVREKTYREQCAEVTARVLALRNELFRVSDDMTEAFRRPFWGTGIPDDKKPFASAMNYAVQSLYMAVNKDLEAIQQLFTAYVEGEAILNGGNGLKFV